MDEADESRPAADRAESARRARSNYLLYLVSTGCGFAIGVLLSLSVFDEPDAGPLVLLGGLFVLVVLIIAVARAHMDRKKADETMATHFRVQIRTFWIYFLYAVGMSLAVNILGAPAAGSGAAAIASQIVWIAMVAWFVIRCVKGLRYLSRQEPYPNPGTWLW